MFDFIPVDQYTFFYYQILLFFLIVFLLHAFTLEIDDQRNTSFLRVFGYLLLIFVILYMGFRPIHKVFVDMEVYAYTFERFQENDPINVTYDYGFYAFMDISSKLMTKEFFFFVCAFIYITPLFLISKKFFKQYWFYSFLMLVGSFSFWAYGTNGIRNGIATSLFLFALAFNERKIVMIVLLVLACSMHKSMLLPSLAYGLTFVNNNPKKYFYIWLAAIPLSLVLGGFWENLFAGLGFGDDRLSYLTSGNVNDDDFRSTGFRWDFLLYSASGVFAGYYFVIKKGFQDKRYLHLLNTYLLVNAFWILIIRANFSNRFAYLSWFMLGLVIIYPFLMQKTVQYKLMGKIIFIYIFFTFFMNVILAK